MNPVPPGDTPRWKPDGQIYLSVDVEEFYQAEVFSGILDRSEWDRFPSRVEENTLRLVDRFVEWDVRGTFFIVGDVARKHPSLVRAIERAGNEVGSHGRDHRMITRMSPREFEADAGESKKILEDITGKPVRGFRAPTFSIVKETAWSYGILRDAGYGYSSSVFPIHHDRYGWTDFGTSPRKMAAEGGRGIWEIPMSVERCGGINVPFGGGGYLRLYPLFLTGYFFRRLIRAGGNPILYVHPWEFDLEHPEVDMPFLRRFRHYVGISGAEEKLRLLVKRFSFDRLDHLLLRLENGATT